VSRFVGVQQVRQFFLRLSLLQFELACIPFHLEFALGFAIFLDFLCYPAVPSLVLIHFLLGHCVPASFFGVCLIVVCLVASLSSALLFGAGRLGWLAPVADHTLLPAICDGIMPYSADQWYALL
jgi:hypothetical protein